MFTFVPHFYQPLLSGTVVVSGNLWNVIFLLVHAFTDFPVDLHRGTAHTRLLDWKMRIKQDYIVAYTITHVNIVYIYRSEQRSYANKLCRLSHKPLSELKKPDKDRASYDTHEPLSGLTKINCVKRTIFRRFQLLHYKQNKQNGRAGYLFIRKYVTRLIMQYFLKGSIGDRRIRYANKPQPLMSYCKWLSIRLLIL